MRRYLFIATFILLNFSLVAKPLVVVIDPGHGGTNKGVVYEDIEEKDLTLALAKKIAIFIRKHSNITVYLTRTVDHNVSMKKRIRFINEKKPDIFLSIHFNAQILLKTNRGFEIYYPSDFLDKTPKEIFVNYDRINRSFKYGALFKKEYFKTNLTTTWKLPLSLFKAHGNLKLLNESHYPGLLLEIAYLTNADDRSCIENPKFVSDVAWYILSVLKQIK